MPVWRTKDRKLDLRARLISLLLHSTGKVRVVIIISSIIPYNLRVSDWTWRETWFYSHPHIRSYSQCNVWFPHTHAGCLSWYYNIFSSSCPCSTETYLVRMQGDAVNEWGDCNDISSYNLAKSCSRHCPPTELLFTRTSSFIHSFIPESVILFKSSQWTGQQISLGYPLSIIQFQFQIQFQFHLLRINLL